MNFFRTLAVFCSLFTATGLYAQQVYELDATRRHTITPVPLPMKGRNPAGVTLSVNSRYFERNGKPWFPVMGEMHFSRYPNRYWEQELLKMKAAGVAIISTYVLWNGHERTPGQWNWQEDNDLRRFVQLCAKHGLYVWLRIGPYCNAEQLYGGLPQWVQSMKGKRTNDPAYLAHATALYRQIGQQAKGLFFENGGPVIGVQLENEYASGQQGHIGRLKQIALDAGIRPVYFSVTANTVFDDKTFEAIPLQGSYPYRGWETGGGKATKDFLFANDQWIMTDAFSKVYYDVDQYPKGLCEQGCGSQMTWYNRFTVDPAVVAAHLQNQVGRGVNLVGYYMLHGGTQTPGLRTPSCPESYDFQAPFGEFGQMRPSLQQLKVLHHFINDFGEALAPMQVVEPPHPVRDETDTARLRYVARMRGEQGFVFLCNTQVRITMPDKPVQLRIHTPGGVVAFPAFTLKGGTAPVLPVNLPAGGATIRYATAQPMARFTNSAGHHVFFSTIDGMPPELALDARTVARVDAAGWEQRRENGLLILRPQQGRIIHLRATNGSKVTVVLLTREEAENSWRMKIGGEEALLITQAGVAYDGRQLLASQTGDPAFTFALYGGGKGFAAPAQPDGPFRRYQLRVPDSYPAVPANDSTVTVPASLPAHIGDLWLEVDYYGSHVTAWQQGRTVTDHLYHGQPWMLGLARYTGNGPLQLRTTAWNDRITGLSPALVQEIKTHPAGIRHIRVVPQYQARLTVQ